ncbi:alpha/beta fold hydrolase [Ramlibacter terrae]|uniref:Alpha/beta fold hydrolase n=1 Tax=Ramlibacter terrae TaxID=2732511 RepID=A0ABX6P5B2_9BURK|nr:alpha/beta fold hydrolase [Ramlibacter terrae]
MTDLRMWDEHRACVGTRYRTIAFTQRYHGASAWQADWPAYGVGTHSQDLTALIEQLDTGPVHLVAWSYAGHVAFDAALRRPELVRSLFVYEPGFRLSSPTRKRSRR